MTRQIVLKESMTKVDRRLLDSDTSSRGSVDYSPRGGTARKLRFAEVAGGTAADCAAVCCCCPCGLVNLLVLAVYKLPVRICSKALRRKKGRRLLKGQMNRCGSDDMEFEILRVKSSDAIVNAFEMTSDDKDVMALDKEMWSKFYGAGFWRSPSKRNDTVFSQVLGGEVAGMLIAASIVKVVVDSFLADPKKPKYIKKSSIQPLNILDFGVSGLTWAITSQGAAGATRESSSQDELHEENDQSLPDKVKCQIRMSHPSIQIILTKPFENAVPSSKASRAIFMCDLW